MINSKYSTITIGGIEIEPGQRTTINLPLARLYTYADMNMPIHVIRGRRSGPTLFVCAAIHGDEINGVEIIRRLLEMKLLNRLRGTLIAVPVVNVYGFITRSRYLPDRRDLNRSFPGTKGGSLASQLANVLINEVVSQCTHGIDLHTGSNHRANLPQVRAYLDDEETARLATAFGAPVVINANLRDGSLREAVHDLEIPVLLYEAGEALRFDESAITVGLRGIVNVMRAIGQLPQRKGQKNSTLAPLTARSTKWVRAAKSGLFHSGVTLGTQVLEGEQLCVISDPTGENAEQILAHISGVVIGKLNLPLVHRGDALYHIARFHNPSTVESTLDEYENELDLEDSELLDVE